MPPRGRPLLVVLSLVASSSVASLSSASFCDAAAACRSLVLAASFAFRRSSALLAAYPGPSSLSSSPRARTSLLTPTAIICHPQSRSQKVQRTSEILKKEIKKEIKISVSIDGPPENSTDLSSGPGPEHSPVISVGGPPRYSYEHAGSQRLALWRCDELCERRALEG